MKDKARKAWPVRQVTAALGMALVADPGNALAGPPFLTDDPEPTDNGHWEIYAPALDAAGAGSEYDGSVGVELNYGAAPNLQLTLGLPAALAHDASGSRFDRGDIRFSAKYRFFHDDAAGLSIAPQH